MDAFGPHPTHAPANIGLQFLDRVLQRLDPLIWDRNGDE
ncbi:uncharacterized protein METZ01_LOCUS34134 [marine metagenome]|uniref:Uncharacterized protein n=1 Tax=marine metagenome TaxID=408172 RepID=A0A381QQC2_9ZZZZ